MPPANDNFTDAIALSGVSGATTGSNVDATAETGEPAATHGSNTNTSVWWQWTAPGDGNVTVDTIGSTSTRFGGSQDTVLEVWTGPNLAGLSPVIDDDDSGGSGNSRLTFAAAGGTTYYWRVYGYGGDYGTISLNWTSDIVPAEAPFSRGRRT